MLENFDYGKFGLTLFIIFGSWFIPTIYLHLKHMKEIDKSVTRRRRLQNKIKE